MAEMDVGTFWIFLKQLTKSIIEATEAAVGMAVGTAIGTVVGGVIGGGRGAILGDLRYRDRVVLQVNRAPEEATPRHLPGRLQGRRRALPRLVLLPARNQVMGIIVERT